MKSFPQHFFDNVANNDIYFPNIGGEVVSKEKIITFNDVYERGSSFAKIINPEGKHADAQYLKSIHVAHIDEHGGNTHSARYGHRL